MNFEDIVVSKETKALLTELKEPNQASMKLEDIVVSASAVKSIQEIQAEERKARSGLIIEAGEGITLGLLGELSAALEAATTDKSYKRAKIEYNVAREQFKKENPALASYSLPAEILASLPTGIGLARALGRAGVKSVAGQAGAEGFIYGAAQGDSFEERVRGGTAGVLTGVAMGRVIDKVVTPSSTGGLRTEANDIADEALDAEGVAAARAIEKEKASEQFTEVDNPKYTRKPLSEAKTAGELWEGVTGAFSNFYNDKVTGVSDELMRVVSPQVGARFQRADETALRNVDKSLGNLAERLVPVIKIINESERAKGTLLDYGAGKLGKTSKQSIARLEKELGEELNSEHMNTLKAYLQVSLEKNSTLNKKVFGADFSLVDKKTGELYSPTYLHTRNNSYIKKLKEGGASDAEIEKMFADKAYEPRSRGSYLDGDAYAPKPSEYDNPIVSDMQRIFKMERLAQVQEKFGVKIDDFIAVKRSLAPEGATVALNPQEFMDAVFDTLTKKGISNDGANYAVNKMTDSIMGQQKAPHPLIQAANSAAYATTLAGPMSAILNLADIPLVAAKYGRAAALEGFQVLNPFKKIPDPDLKKLGLSSQNFGEFVNKTNDLASDTQGFMSSTAAAMRNSADFLMRGSGFASLDMVGKKGVMRGVLKSAANDAKAGKLKDNWSFYFNDAELKAIEGQLKRHGTDWREYKGKGKELVEELMFAGLGQQQLISSAGRPAAWARNPNLRPLWALRGFVVKQQALALREVMGNIKAGKPEKAAEFLGRYAAYGAGGYAVINEGRQFIFGDGEMSFGGLARGYGDAWASLLTANTLGLNDYQYGQIKQNGLLYTIAQGMEPLATSRVRDILGTTIEVLDQDRPPQALALEFPIIKQTLRAGRNVGGLFELEEVVTPAETLLDKSLRD